MRSSSPISAILEAARDDPRSERAISRQATGQPTAIAMIRSGRVPSIERVRRLCEALRLECYVGPPRDPDAERRKEAAALIDELRSDIRAAVVEALRDPPDTAQDSPSTPTRQVELRELRAAAGGGAMDLDETVTDYVPFRRSWLDRITADPTRCTLIGVMGDSMEPTLPQGSSILVDRGQRTRRQGGIFVVRSQDGLVVKRAARDGSGRWLLRSDNPHWKDQAWPADAVLIGEVKWMGRELHDRRVGREPPHWS